MGLFDFFDEQPSLASRVQMLTRMLYDPSVEIRERIIAYEDLSKIDPVNFPPTSRVALVHSVTKGKIAQSAKAIGTIKEQQTRVQLKENRKQTLEDILYDPEENLTARTQAYQELAKGSPEDYPEKDLVGTRKSITTGDIASTSIALHPEYISPQEQRKLDEKKAKEQKTLAKEQEKKLSDQLKEVGNQLSTLKKVRENIDTSAVGLQTGLLDLAEKRLDLETKSGSLDKASPTYKQDSEYLNRHLEILGQREEIFNQRREMANQRVEEIKTAESYAGAKQRYLKGEPEPDIYDDYAVYTWNKDGTLSSIKTEKRLSIDQENAREAGEFAYVPVKQFSEQNIFDAETGSLTSFPTSESQGFMGIAGHETVFGDEEE